MAVFGRYHIDLLDVLSPEQALLGATGLVMLPSGAVPLSDSILRLFLRVLGPVHSPRTNPMGTRRESLNRVFKGV